MALFSGHCNKGNMWAINLSCKVEVMKFSQPPSQWLSSVSERVEDRNGPVIKSEVNRLIDKVYLRYRDGCGAQSWSSRSA